MKKQLLSLLALALPGLAAAQYVPSYPPALVTPPAALQGNPFLQYLPVPGAAPMAIPALPSLPNLSAISIPGLGFNPLLMFGSGQPISAKPYTMRQTIPQETKRQMMQMMMPIMTNVFRMSMPDAMAWMSHKYKAKPGLSFDDVLESMNLARQQAQLQVRGLQPDVEGLQGRAQRPGRAPHRGPQLSATSRWAATCSRSAPNSWCSCPAVSPSWKTPTRTSGS
jgi:hypothetical protein